MISLPVSVVLPVYNGERYLARSIASALGQTRPALEVLVIDDGSTDGSASVARTFAADPRVRVLSVPNGGPARARNIGVREARGELIAFLDADDVWNPRKLARQVPLFLTAPEPGVVYCQRETIDEADNVLSGYRPQLYSGHILDRLYVESFICLSSSVVKRGVFDRVGLFDESLRMSEDYEFWLRVAVEFPFQAVTEPLVQYRVHSAQTSTRTEERVRTVVEIREKFDLSFGHLVGSGVRRRARAHQYFTRAYRAEQRGDRWGSLHDYLRALRLVPFHLPAFKGVVKAVLPSRIRTRIRPESAFPRPPRQDFP